MYFYAHCVLNSHYIDVDVLQFAVNIFESILFSLIFNEIAKQCLVLAMRKKNAKNAKYCAFIALYTHLSLRA